MKTLAFAICMFFLAFLTTVSGQSNLSLSQIANSLDTVKSIETFQQYEQWLTDQTELDSNWLKPYYRAYCSIQLLTKVFTEQAALPIDTLRLGAFRQLKAAAALGGDKSEIETLRALFYLTYLMEDAMGNGQVYFGSTLESLDIAESTDPTNPRPPLIRGMLTIGTPAAFGGGKEAALPMLEAAQAAFDQAPPNGAAPSWGRVLCAELLEQVRG